jgi:hypothetical protein
MAAFPHVHGSPSRGMAQLAVDVLLLMAVVPDVGDLGRQSCFSDIIHGIKESAGIRLLPV